MKWESVKTLTESAFRRLTGVKRATFHTIVDVIKVAYGETHKAGGRPSALTAEDKALMTLEYWREYRTYFHIGEAYGIAESSAYKNIRAVENALIKSKKFALPGKEALLTESDKHKEIVIDVTESPIERPKKNKKSTTPARKRNIP